MRFLKAALCFSLAVALGISAPGCKKKTESANNGKTKQEHTHPTEGPHGGKIIELGDEEYHAELKDDKKAKTVTIYILDSSAKKQVAVDAKEIVINLTHDGNPEQFKLKAHPDKGDEKGKCSRFSLGEMDGYGELSHDLTHKDAKPKMTILIGGKSFVGDLK